jgi:uncharacterized protein with NAD-binding domain and iron-sulfur cluster
MHNYLLTIHLMSDATFGRGEGIAGLVDTEIEHDAYGCPFIGGRTLKGLLREECNTLCHTLARNDSNQQWYEEAAFLLGISGDTTGDNTASMHVGAATLPPTLLNHIHYAVKAETLSAADVLASLTTIRRQTAVDVHSDAPATGSLRSERALLRTTYLIATLSFEQPPAERHLALLSACVLAVRRGGLGRNRGRGALRLLLHEQHPGSYDDETFTRQWFTKFVQEVRG